MTLRAGLGIAIGAAVAALSACGNDQSHPPYASGTCSNPPCLHPAYHGGPAVDSGVADKGSRDAGADGPG